MTPSTHIAPESLQALRTQIRGDAFVPGDPGYDGARMAWNLSVQQHPAAVVTATGPSDIVAALRFARQEGLGVAVQSTGHGVIRPANDCLLIVTSPMADVRVDAAAQTAWVEAGAHG